MCNRIGKSCRHGAFKTPPDAQKRPWRVDRRALGLLAGPAIFVAGLIVFAAIGKADLQDFDSCREQGYSASDCSEELDYSYDPNDCSRGIDEANQSVCGDTP